MTAKHTITINGLRYDAVTGLPVGAPDGPGTAIPPRSRGATMDISKPIRTDRRSHQKASPAKGIHHSATQRSATLRRHLLSSPQPLATTQTRPRRSTTSQPRSPMVAHFAPHPQPLKQPATLTESTRIEDKPLAPPKPQHGPQELTGQHVKHRLIAHAAAQLGQTAAKTKKQSRGRLRIFSPKRIAAASTAVLLLAAYFAYTSIPGISVGLAGSQAGVAAHYPNYHPDGYSFQGPVAFEPGQVEIKFTSNGGGNGYTVKQQASSWNATAVLDNLVSGASNGRYDSTNKNGLIIYTYNNRAAWSNGGVLYTIEGDAPLSTDQLLDIASSM